MAATVLNSVQQHLLKMFAFDGSEERLNEVKEVNKIDYRRIIINEKHFYKMIDK